MQNSWTRPRDIVTRMRTRWESGQLLRAYGNGDVLVPVEIAVRGPSVPEIGENVTAVQDWRAELEAASRDGEHFDLQFKNVGGRKFGRNEIPARAIVRTYEQAWNLLGVSREVSRYDGVLAAAAAEERVLQWVVNYPLQALAVTEDLDKLLETYRWLAASRGSGKYLREIAVPGVDTKFAERHRDALAKMLAVGGSAKVFAADLGLGQPPQLVRMRLGARIQAVFGVSEIAVRADELAQWDLGALGIAIREALVIENEITFLSVPIGPDSVVMWGRGFAVDLVGRTGWLKNIPVRYWGDIDTHGFAILDRLRAYLPQTVSVLMDRETLLNCRDFWVTEKQPTRSGFTRLTPAELALYEELVTDAHGVKVRLEQERIPWNLVQRTAGIT